LDKTDVGNVKVDRSNLQLESSKITVNWLIHIMLKCTWYNAHKESINTRLPPSLCLHVKISVFIKNSLHRWCCCQPIPLQQITWYCRSCFHHKLRPALQRRQINSTDKVGCWRFQANNALFSCRV